MQTKSETMFFKDEASTTIQVAFSISSIQESEIFELGVVYLFIYFIHLKNYDKSAIWPGLFYRRHIRPEIIHSILSNTIL